MMLLDFFPFMFFSTFEGLAVYALAFYVFRFDFKRYIGHSLIIIEIINLQNFLTREEVTAVSNLAPVINLIVTIIFFRTIARIPLLGSLVMACFGYASMIAIQAGLIFSLFSLDQIHAHPLKGHIVQLLTGMIGIITGWQIYKRGYGFAKDFEKFRFKWEHMLVLFMTGAFIVLLGFMMYFLDVFGSLIGFVVSLILLLLYSLRKEREINR
ncbi:hypothetical protein [Paenibacillus silvisoli]|uniref:hypothetical protein n=1 Tax=Paenibacillus silvisoli TaxID=3110539 RepID=UPI002805863A|nr:hypothetical protein [Paenibacillus silvisoli]